jgi:hypothetical protein
MMSGSGCSGVVDLPVAAWHAVAASSSAHHIMADIDTHVDRVSGTRCDPNG